MKWTLIGLLAALLVLALSVACAKPHPVQPLPASYRPPLVPRGCQVRGEHVTIHGQTFVAWTCQDGLRLTDKRSGRVEAFVSWQEIGKR